MATTNVMPTKVRSQMGTYRYVRGGLVPTPRRPARSQQRTWLPAQVPAIAGAASAAGPYLNGRESKLNTPAAEPVEHHRYTSSPVLQPG